MCELELKNIFKHYKATSAAENISLKLHCGETIGLVGESGCGKSTVAGIISNLINADSGEVIYNGKNIKHLNKEEFRQYRKNVQMVFQDSGSAINPRFSAGKCIAEPMENFLNLSKEEMQKRIKQLIISVGLSEDYINKYPKQLSGGEKQRIAIARAIALNPQFLILDEVTSSLDVSIQAQILNLLLDLKDKYGMGGLFISHDLSVVKYMCDIIFVMYKGRIIEIIRGNKLMNATHPYTKLLLKAIPSIGINSLLNEEPPIEEKDGFGGGCVFYGRCRERKSKCEVQSPILKEIDESHYTACLCIQGGKK